VSKVDIALPAALRRINADGSLNPAATTVTLRNGEAAFFVR
jgi:hypothetical protein